ncbi:MAG: hypothetical protein AB1801_06195 [Chloroflexota bacterium]
MGQLPPAYAGQPAGVSATLEGFDYTPWDIEGWNIQDWRRK